MSMQKKPQMVEAVVFFNDRGVCKEMLYPEFEALLDNVVQMPDLAEQQVQLAYVLINPRLMVKAAVFFYLDFDENGEADRGWNLPLRNLADRAGRGPDLGAGPIRLACRSQCPVPWHQMHLWDPVFEGDDSHLAKLRAAAKRNNLGVLVEEEPAAVEPQRLQMAAEHQWYAPSEEESRETAEKLAREMLQEHEQKTAALLDQQELRLSQISLQHEQELSRLKLDAQEQIQVLQAEVSILREGLKREEDINADLRRELDGQVSGFQRGREELTEQLRQIEASGRDELEQLRQQIEDEAKARIAALEARYQEQVSVRDAELGYRNELDQQLQQENQQLQQESRRLQQENQTLRQEAEKQRQEAERLRQALDLLKQQSTQWREQAEELQQSVESLRQELAAQSTGAADSSMLERLAGQGVVFVVYHPGAGHLTLSLADVTRYQENPMAFAAAKCFVSEDQYRQWLAHYQQPTCEGRLSNGDRCALPIDRVETPGRFIEGDSNCCARHKTAGRLRSVTTA
ncbi:chromosome partitioning protein ParA [Pseudomonas sp. LA21]|uniref:chromosome partitioning protein ParA n=1 Tax=unclassified Pseudomonas TaxID=196821 RepID=UPI001FB7BD29|nr:chromosome partitioning protein ParA [Pseudomonas sp. LA21]MCJ1887926.1 chromosome partitioning protein ParA [Pseudomonas sp. LA21]